MRRELRGEKRKLRVTRQFSEMSRRPSSEDTFLESRLAWPCPDITVPLGRWTLSSAPPPKSLASAVALALVRSTPASNNTMRSSREEISIVDGSRGSRGLSFAGHSRLTLQLLLSLALSVIPGEAYAKSDGVCVFRTRNDDAQISVLNQLEAKSSLPSRPDPSLVVSFPSLFPLLHLFEVSLLLAGIDVILPREPSRWSRLPQSGGPEHCFSPSCPHHAKDTCTQNWR